MAIQLIVLVAVVPYQVVAAVSNAGSNVSRPSRSSESSPTTLSNDGHSTAAVASVSCFHNYE